MSKYWDAYKKAEKLGYNHRDCIDYGKYKAPESIIKDERVYEKELAAARRGESLAFYIEAGVRSEDRIKLPSRTTESMTVNSKFPSTVFFEAYNKAVRRTSPVLANHYAFYVCVENNIYSKGKKHDIQIAKNGFFTVNVDEFDEIYNSGLQVHNRFFAPKPWEDITVIEEIKTHNKTRRVELNEFYIPEVEEPKPSTSVAAIKEVNNNLKLEQELYVNEKGPWDIFFKIPACNFVAVATSGLLSYFFILPHTLPYYKQALQLLIQTL